MSMLKRLFGPIWRWLNDPAPYVMYDRQVVWLSFGLMVTGLIMVASASIPVAWRQADTPFYYAIRHAAYLLGSLSLMYVVIKKPLAFWFKYSYLLLGIAAVLLVMVLVVGRSINGAVRWLPFFFINVQPAEIAKLATVLFLASYLVRQYDTVRTSRGKEFAKAFLKPVLVLACIAGLIVIQPDLGSVIVMFVMLVGMLFIAGINLIPFAVLLAIGLAGLGALAIFEPYRLLRMTSFLDPWQDPFGSGYQLTQSLMAFGRGNWWGQGLGNSIQKLEYLPEAHTDFVIAVLAEELGLIGVIAVVVMVFSLVYRAIFIGRRCLEANQLFSGFCAFGIAIWFAFQSLVNIGAAAGMMPTKGLTLPLISYGGSSLFIMSTAVAILLRIDYEYRIQLSQGNQRKKSNEKQKQ